MNRLSNYIPLVYPAGAHITVADQGAETILAISTTLGQHKGVSQLTLSSDARAALHHAIVPWRDASGSKPDVAELVLLACTENRQVIQGRWDGDKWLLGPELDFLGTVFAWAPLPKRPDPTEVLSC